MDCDIYAGVFGEVDLEQVCGVVQELVNIVGGIVKPKIKDQKSIIGIAHPSEVPLKEFLTRKWLKY